MDTRNYCITLHVAKSHRHPAPATWTQAEFYVNATGSDTAYGQAVYQARKDGWDFLDLDPVHVEVL